MGSTIQRLQSRELIQPPQWLADNVHYECIMGSVAYGVSDDTSDMDLYGFCIPPKHLVFPHLAGEIFGFGRQVKRFEQYQQHGIKDESALGGKGREYDISMYSIVKYFQLCMENNPNMIDSLFVPFNCAIHCTNVGNMVRENRRMFLHKGCWHKFRGYSYSQVHKIKTKNVTGLKDFMEMEKDLGIDHKTTLDDVEKEMTRRGLLKKDKK
jgi:predicted nucleotidyltransferase